MILTVGQVQAVLAQMEGEHALLARLLYGTGMRLMEGLRLRVKDIEFERRAIVVREGKGSKDRVVMLPAALEQPLRRGDEAALDGLVHNAGLMPKQRSVTRQGHELQLATHILGPHLMTERLLPLLRAARGASVVFVSSGGMYSSPLVVDDLESAQDYNGVRTYARTKRMQVVLADAWAHRLAGANVKVESMHPGWVDTPGVAEYLPRFRVITRPLLREVADGADTAVWLVATRPESRPGHFWHDRAQRPTTFGWQRAENPARVRRFLQQVSDLTGTSKTWT